MVIVYVVLEYIAFTCLARRRAVPKILYYGNS